MNPMQALAEIDAALAEVTSNRVGHAHLIKCVAIVRAALKPEEQADGYKA